VVLAAFLVFAGFGARYSGRLAASRAGPSRGHGPRAALRRRAAAAARRLMGLPQIAKVLLTIALVAPLAFCLGMPFPLGTRGGRQQFRGPSRGGRRRRAGAVGLGHQRLRLGRRHPRRRAARHPLGHSAVILLAVVLYAVAAVQFPRRY